MGSTNSELAMAAADVTVELPTRPAPRPRPRPLPRPDVEVLGSDVDDVAVAAADPAVERFPRVFVWTLM